MDRAAGNQQPFKPSWHVILFEPIETNYRVNFQLEIQTGAQAGFNFRVLFVDFPSRKPGRN